MHAGDNHDVMAILAWIPPADRDRITAIMYTEAGVPEGWVLITLADACRKAGRAPARRAAERLLDRKRGHHA